MSDDAKTEYTPALGRHELTTHYDPIIAVMTRERRWRSRLLSALSIEPGQTIVDIGSGTGTMAIQIKRAEPSTRVFAIDPDPKAMEIARLKARQASVDITFINSMSSNVVETIGLGTVDKVVSSLVLHQCSLEAKQGILTAAWLLLRTTGRLLIADYGLQRSLLMDLLFRQVRSLDGYENTQANRDGKIPDMMVSANFDNVEELWSIPTPTGSISLYSGRKT